MPDRMSSGRMSGRKLISYCCRMKRVQVVNMHFVSRRAMLAAGGDHLGSRGSSPVLDLRQGIERDHVLARLARMTGCSLADRSALMAC